MVKIGVSGSAVNELAGLAGRMAHSADEDTHQRGSMIQSPPSENSKPECTPEQKHRLGQVYALILNWNHAAQGADKEQGVSSAQEHAEREAPPCSS